MFDQLLVTLNPRTMDGVCGMSSLQLLHDLWVMRPARGYSRSIARDTKSNPR